MAKKVACKILISSISEWEASAIDQAKAFS
jgi:hypothetical protein